jgi:2,6-dihydroxypyridine 3-monooxygenase
VQIAVVGGSLGGLTAACLLADDGHDVSVYERSNHPLEERGAGIGFLPATARYLRECASVDISSISVSTSRIQTLARDNSVLHESTHTYLFSSWNTVYRKTLERLDPTRYLLGHELVNIDPDLPGLTFRNGLIVQPELAICADGIGSAAREKLLPGRQPGYAGYVAWRGVVEETKLSASTREILNDALTYYVYANSHILVYPIPGRDGSVAPGERLINIVWYRNYSDGDDLNQLLTDAHGQRRDVSVPPGLVHPNAVQEAKAHARTRLPASIAEVVQAIDDLFIQVIVDMTVDRMVFGRTCILGDAAFAARPHAAAGTAKAAADGWALRDAVRNSIQECTDGGDAPLLAALKAWEPGQLQLGHSLVERTRIIGKRSQFEGTWVPGDPSLIFGLHEPGN